MDLDAEFDKIIQDAISKACGIECSIESFIDQLKGWQESIQTQILASEGDLRRQQEKMEAAQDEEEDDG